MFRILIRTPARSFGILYTEPTSRSFSISRASRFIPSHTMADSAQSTPVESSASTPAPNANAPAQQKQQQQNNKKQNRPPHPNAANAKPKPVKREVRILMLHGRFTVPDCTDNCPSSRRPRGTMHLTEWVHLTHRAHLIAFSLSPPTNHHHP